MKSAIYARLRMIFSEDEIDRISINEESEMGINVTVDVHGMKCNNAKRFINNIINMIRVAFKLIVIHGYNNGTAIKDMLAESFSNIHIVNQFQDPYNLGVTYIILGTL